MTQKPGRKHFRARLDQMVSDIRERIYKGEYDAGHYLPSEKTLAKQYQLSNKTVRQGLEILRQEKWIDTIPRVGNKVMSRAREGIVPLRFGYYPSLMNEAAIDKLLDMFHAAYPHIRVEAEIISTSDHQRFREKAAGFDVVTMNYTHFHDSVLHGEINQWEPLEANVDHYPFLTDAMRHQQELKVKPFIFSPIILCYNKNHFREKELQEPDSTWRWDQLRLNAAKLAEDYKRLGFYFHFLSTNRWPVFLLQSGFTYDKGNEDSIVAKQVQLLKSLNACRDLISMQNRFPLVLSEKDGDAEELFFEGKISMIMTSYFSLNHHRGQSSFTYDMAPLPYIDYPRTLLLIIGLALNKQCREKGSAKLFIDFLTSYSSQLYIRQNTLSIPSFKTAAEWTGEEKMYRPSKFQIYREMIPTFRLFSDLNLSSEQLAVFLREAKLYWSGLETESNVVPGIARSLRQVDSSVPVES